MATKTLQVDVVCKPKRPRFNPKMKAAVDLVAQGLTSAEIGRRLEVVPQTVRYWRARPDFQAEVNAILVEANQYHGERLRQLADKALDTLQDLLANADTPPGVKGHAACKVLELAGIKPPAPGSTDPMLILARLQSDRLLLELFNRMAELPGFPRLPPAT